MMAWFRDADLAVPSRSIVSLYRHRIVPPSLQACSPVSQAHIAVGHRLARHDTWAGSTRISPGLLEMKSREFERFPKRGCKHRAGPRSPHELQGRVLRKE